MTLRVEVGKKGYMIIPKNVRDLLGINEGDFLELRVENGKIVLEKERKVDLEEVERKFEEHERRIAYARRASLGDLKGVVLEEEFDD
ncbi:MULTISPECIES: AbrB/MazE/SpoVT family DNA-binding domain-containing protein [Metallosphaera]|uniref:Transcriptional regulator, AbrB family n=4 Tax=Metallosphaera TaxID=41980 RepID=A4YGB4_METS5|nr:MULTISPECIES: AbrB/MazE/SpoVT family DNA-binding domain-containing protein [Metallosphaera]ABP95466.1 transcriptional regulator, AbrB family [Metallosphaera sedula DSM 5348]AIM27451.1 transcriptional regulator, AbrB family [Metallosphaera sedula]MCY0861622.1 AbrB/MazE/SpoVT family DNA-binding domain-containing protein [Metallosphaera prunae]QCO31085.1 AbrB/MazE/SpoVT family DNA-binding domain-containing protein [Metallosphaera prunae]WPX05316.1 AbrB/MazE/SpoVT family DNA-binding domain-cont